MLKVQKAGFRRKGHNHGGAHARFDKDQRLRRRNSIIHGLDSVKEDELLEQS